MHKTILLLTIIPSLALAVSKSGSVSVIVNGYITLPDIENQQFAPITEASATAANSVTQSPYNIETSYDVVSPTPNITLTASVDAQHEDSTGAFMTNNPGSSSPHKIYFTMKYDTCGDHADKPLIAYNTGSVFPNATITNAEATASACATQAGSLTYTRVAIPQGSYPPSGSNYTATVTLTAQAAGV